MARLIAALLFLIPTLASANVGRRNSEATPVGEPLGLIDVAIVREELAIDLRRVDRNFEINDTASVSVTYHLDNRGDPKQLALIFASGAASLTGFEVTLDGAAIRSELVSTAKLPESWQPPQATPGPSGPISYAVDRNAGAATFDLALPSGAHRLVIRYRAAPSHHHTDEPTVMHQFAYVLAPARSWASFGQLSVTVQVPAGWRAEITPALERDGDTLKGTFTGVPADALAITTYSPAGPYQLLRVVGLLGFGVGLLGGGFALRRIMLKRAQRQAIGGDTAPAFALSVVWAAAIVASGWFAIFGPELALVDGQVARHGYGDGVTMVGIVALALVVIPVGTLVGRSLGRRSTGDLTAS